MIDVSQTLRYSLVSGFCLVLSVVTIPLLSSWGLHYALATLIAFCMLAVIGFILHSRWTFQVEFSFSSFLLYLSTIAINLPVAVVMMGIAHDLVGLSVAISTVMTSAALFLWNYLAARWAVVRPATGSPS